MNAHKKTKHAPTKKQSASPRAKAPRAKGKSVPEPGTRDGAPRAVEQARAAGATFADLCKELGKRLNSTENALLCYRAYQAYLREQPDTAHGKANKLDRDPTIRSFRHAAAAESGVAAATIDALLQVGKAIDPLPNTVKEELVSSSLGNSMRALRKLATTEFDATRAQLISNFVKEEKADARSAKASLKKTLGMAPSVREGVEAKMVVEPESHELAEGEHWDVKAGQFTFRVEVGGQAGGRIRVTLMAFTGEHKPAPPFLGQTQPAVALNDASTTAVETETEAA